MESEVQVTVDLWQQAYVGLETLHNHLMVYATVYDLQHEECFL